MRFELDDTLTDDIIFHMENQENDFLLDTREGCVIGTRCDDIKESDCDDAERYIPLPAWEPKDGYRLMEKFTASLKNPVVRHELSESLNKNKGVFRAFRDVLEQYPDTEKMWFRFKEQKMKNEVVSWYNALREEWGLEPIGAEPEDTMSLVLEDFIIKKGESDFHFIAESSDGVIAGSINAVWNGAILEINKFEIKNEYRCMGIGKTLLSKVIEKADENKLDISIDIPFETDFFSRSLLLENFKPVMQRFVRKNHTT
ncbi:MAG: GNAT family N-acetyltransferase [Treponema sp.]|nr:GNAT family N-acetyltransferase [Treponema sp.]